MKKGKFFVLCGGEGSGKSTVLDEIRKRYPDLVTTREPGGSPYAENIRNLMFKDPLGKEATASTMFCLFWAARSEHLEKTVIEALSSGRNVLSDRLDCCTYAYQLHGQQALQLREFFWTTRYYLMEECRPDLYIFLDVDVRTGLARVASRKGDTNHFDERDISFHERVRAGYSEFFSRINDGYVKIDANQSLEEVVEAVSKAISSRLI